jgi:hypothetical protein
LLQVILKIENQARASEISNLIKTNAGIPLWVLQILAERVDAFGPMLIKMQDGEIGIGKRLMHPPRKELGDEPG